MTCCGNLIETTTHEDRAPQFLCQECGKQGPQSLFPDVEVQPEPESRIDRARWWLAERLADLAARVAPK